MSTYQEIIGQVADQWVAAFKRTEDAVSRYAENVQNARPNFEVPGLPTPESLAELNQTLTEKLPKPSEIVAANFDLASRLLTAQRDLALRLLEEADKTAKADAPKVPAAKAPAAKVDAPKADAAKA